MTLQSEVIHFEENPGELQVFEDQNFESESCHSTATSDFQISSESDFEDNIFSASDSEESFNSGFNSENSLNSASETDNSDSENDNVDEITKNLDKFIKVTGRQSLNFDDEDQLLEQVKQQRIDPRTIEKCLANYDNFVNCNSPLQHGIVVKKCACCGIAEFAPKKVKSAKKMGASQNRWRTCKNFKEVSLLKVKKDVKKSIHPFANVLKVKNDWYYLIPDLVKFKNPGYSFDLCPSCDQSLENEKLPKFCVATNYDLHRVPKLLKENNLSWLEEILISFAVPLVYTMKVKGNVNATESLTSHVVCIPHEGVEIARKLPWTNISEVIQVQVYNQQIQDAKRTLRILPQFNVCPRRILIWLTHLKKTNPLYKDIEIEIDENFQEQILEQLEANLKLINDKDVVELDENCVTHYTEDETEKFGGSCIYNVHQGTSETLVKRFSLNVSKTSYYNDYNDTPEMLYKSFPSKIPFNCNLGNGPPCVELRRKMFLYYDGRFANDKNFLFFIFNQTMRTKVNSSAALYIKNNIESIEEMNKILSDPALLDKLEIAIKYPKSKESEEILHKISKHLHVPGSSIPFSNYQRNLSLAEMISYYRHFGPPSFFITVSPSNLDNPLTVKLAGYKDKDNLNMHFSRKLMETNPIACVESFFRLMDGMFSHLIGMKSSSSKRKTYIVKEKFLFGTPIAFYGVIEAQQRGALHIHYLLWTKISPELLRYSCTRKHILNELIKTIDSMVIAYLPQETLQNYYLSKKNNLERVRIGLQDTPNFNSLYYANDWVAQMAYPKKQNPTTRPLHLTEVNNSIFFTQNIPNHDTNENDLFDKDTRVIFWELARPDPNFNPPLNLDGYPIDNSYVVEYSLPLTAALKSNTSVGLLGATSAAKSTMLYLAKYMSKDPTLLTQTLPLFLDAHKKSSNSTAQDAGTPKRTVTFVFQRFLNNLTKFAEYPQEICAAVVLGYKPTVKSHDFEFCFTSPALKYMKTIPPHNSHREPEQTNQRINGSSQNNNSEYEETVDMNEQATVEFNSLPFHVDESNKIAESKHLQHLNYAFRGEHLASLNFYEYCSLINIKRKPTKNADTEKTPKRKSNSKNKPKLENTRKKPGRPAGKTYSFAPNHPKFATHVQYFTSKIRVPMIVGQIPTYKKNCNSDNEEWATFMSCIYIPWDSHSNTQNPNMIQQLIKYMKYGSTLDKLRFQLIQEISVGLRCSKQEQSLLGKYRSCTATRWSDLSAPFIPNFQAQQVEDEVRELIEIQSNSLADNEDVSTSTLQFLNENFPTPAIDSSNFSAANYFVTAPVDQIFEKLKSITILPEVENENITDNPSKRHKQSQLNLQQQAVFDFCQCIIREKQLKLIIHGGPGTGKSFLSNVIANSFAKNQFKCCAPTGIAASLLLDGKTLHSMFGFSKNNKSFQTYEQFIAAQQISERKLKLLQQDFKNTKLIILDEMSMATLTRIYQIHHRLKQITEIDQPFGGLHIILSGDFYQLPPVNGSIWPCSFLEYAQLSHIERLAIDLLKPFYLANLTFQNRSSDIIQNEIILKCRSSDSINGKSLLENYVKNKPNHNVESTTILVPDNFSRSEINFAQAIKYAKQHNLPIFAWKKICTNDLTGDMHKIFDRKQCIEVFVKGAPAQILENINVSMKIANGTRCTMHSLTLHEDQILPNTTNQLITWISPPKSINVEIEINSTNWPPHSYISNGNATIIPIMVSSKKDELMFKTVKGTSIKLSFKGFPLTLAFALTFHKCQGLTLAHVLIDARKNHHKSFDFAALYVAISRVSSSSKISLFPMSMHDWNLVLKKRPNAQVEQWLNMYTSDLQFPFIKKLQLNE